MSYNFETIENKLKDVHANLPHLSVTGPEWLANNAWWIVLIGAVVGAFGALVLITITMLGGVILAGAAFLFSAHFGGLVLLIAVIVVTLTLANVTFSIMAVSPLKRKIRKGWLFLAAALLAGFVAALLTDLMRQDVWAILKEVVFIAIGLYVLFEIREYFPEAPNEKPIG